MVTPEIEIFKSAQLRFFRSALDAVQVCDFRDPEKVSQEVEEIGKGIMNVPFVTGYEAESSYNSTSGYNDFNSTFSRSSSRLDEDANSPKDTPKDNPPASAPWMSPTDNKTSPSYSAPKPPATQTTQAKVLYDYTALDHTEISLVFGETITVEEKHSSGWWTGKKSNGTKGLFPSNYIEVLP